MTTVALGATQKNWRRHALNQLSKLTTATTQKFSIKDFCKYDQIRNILQTWSHLLKKSLMENFILYSVRNFQNYFKKERFYQLIIWFYITVATVFHCTKMEFSIKNFCSKRDQTRSFLRILSHLLMKLLLENFIFCAVFAVSYTEPVENTWTNTLQNLCCQIEVFFTVESFLKEKPENF